MEKVEYHTQEEKKICDWIKAKRAWNRENLIRKTISVHVYIDGLKLRCCCKIDFNKYNGSIVLSHSIAYGHSFDVYPTTNHKLRCINDHARNMYKKGQYEMWKKECKSIIFTQTIMPYIQLFEEIQYYNDRSVVISSYFHPRKKELLKVINETEEDAQASVKRVFEVAP